MLWTIVGGLLLLWGIGVVTSTFFGGGIHILFAVAVLLASVSVLRRRNPL